MRRAILLVVALLLATACGSPSHAQSFAGKKYFSVASVNSTLVRGGKTLLGPSSVSNTTATIYYLKFYNKSTAPTCGTDVPVWTVMIPANLNTSINLAGGMLFSSGLGFCLTAAFADADTGVAATGVLIDLGVTGQ